MIKTKRTDFYDLNTDGNMDLNKVNDLLTKLTKDYNEAKSEEIKKETKEKKDGE